MNASLTDTDPRQLRRGPLHWERDAADWPLREHSLRIVAGGIEWHVQRYGAGPTALLLHGTGAATHSWRGLGPLLARRYTVVAPDLPGHGFTQTLPGPRWSLPGVARAVSELARTMGSPALVVGHSAGAAIAVRATLDGGIAPGHVVSVNGALHAWRGPAAVLFAPLAKLMASTSFVPGLFARRAADRAVVERLVGNTGSRLDRRAVEYYARTVRNPAHVAGALQMMANWDLAPLERDLPRLGERLLLIAGASDRTVPPTESRSTHARTPGSSLVVLPGLGHLAHEEAPEAVAAAIEAFASRVHASKQWSGP